MAYIGKTPTAVPLTSGDITNGIITTAKIADNAISAAKLASGVGGKVLQVITAIQSDVFESNTTGSFTDITGMSASITPSSTSNKILVLLNVNSDAGNNSHIRLVRGSTAIGIGDGENSRSRVSGAAARNSTSDNNMMNNGISFLDSPSSTSATTYKVQFYLWSSTTFTLNRSLGDGNDGYAGRSASTITLMEIAG